MYNICIYRTKIFAHLRTEYFNMKLDISMAQLIIPVLSSSSSSYITIIWSSSSIKSENVKIMNYTYRSFIIKTQVFCQIHLQFVHVVFSMLVTSFPCQIHSLNPPLQTFLSSFLNRMNVLQRLWGRLREICGLFFPFSRLVGGFVYGSFPNLV